MLTVTSEDVCWSIRNVKFDIIKVTYTIRLLSLMFVTAVCVFKYCHVINTVNQTNEILVKAMFPFQCFYFHSLLVLGPAVTFLSTFAFWLFNWAHPGFLSMQHTWVLLLPPGRDSSPSLGYFPAVCRRQYWNDPDPYMIPKLTPKWSPFFFPSIPKLSPIKWHSATEWLVYHSVPSCTNAARCGLRHLYREDLGTRMSCFGCKNKNGRHFTRFKSKNNSWN